jgi:NhaA family Na+:H+ antiporter
VLFGLVVGQPAGVVAGTFLGTRFTERQLPHGLKWADVVVVGTLASIGFTVALLVSEVSFGDDPKTLMVAKFALVLTSFVSIGSAVTAMKLRARSLE